MARRREQKITLLSRKMPQMKYPSREVVGFQSPKRTGTELPELGQLAMQSEQYPALEEPVPNLNRLGELTLIPGGLV